MSSTDSGKNAGDGRPDESLVEAVRHEAADVGEAAVSARQQST